MRTRAIRTRLLATGAVLGCTLMLPAVSGYAQSGSARLDDPQSASQTTRDRWDSGKVSGIQADAGYSVATSLQSVRPGSREAVQQYVNQKLAFWQQNLKLTDWHISWTLARRDDLKPNTVGQIHWDKPSHCASVLVLDPSDYRLPYDAMLDDMELTIIHELVHLKLTSLPHSEASRGSEEQAVNGLSEALFALERQKR